MTRQSKRRCAKDDVIGIHSDFRLRKLGSDGQGASHIDIPGAKASGWAADA